MMYIHDVHFITRQGGCRWRRGVAAFALWFCFIGGLPAQARQTKIRIAADVQYQFDEPLERADVYFPDRSGNAGPTPAVIWMHGSDHDKADSRERNVCTELAGAGYVAISINYGDWPETDADEQKSPRILQNVVNARNAVRFFRAHAAEYGIDPRRIGLFGGSAGAWLALVVGLGNGDAAFDSAPPYPGVSSAVSAIGDFYGDTDPWIKSKISGKSPPVLIVQGKADPAVDFHESIELGQLLEGAGVPHELVLLEGVGHAFDLTSWRNKPLPQDLRPVVFAFLKGHLAAVDPVSPATGPVNAEGAGEGLSSGIR